MIDKTVLVGKNDSPEVTIVNNVPYIVYESSMASSERFIKRLIIALIVSITLLFISNLIWLKAWTSYDYTSESETTTYSQDGQGTNIIGSMNEVE